MRSGSHQPPRASAFTLIELMVVLTLIAILSAMILPEMRGSLEDAVLRSSARNLISVFGLANARAVSVGQPHRVHLDLASGKYQVETRTGGRDSRAGFTRVRDLSGSEGRLDSRVLVELRPSVTAGSIQPADAAAPPTRVDAVTFYPDGTADAMELTLRDRAGVSLGLRLNPVTARVQILERSRP